MFVVPKEGLLIRDPETKQVLPAEGKEVPANPFWMRRLRDGDVTAFYQPDTQEDISARLS